MRDDSTSRPSFSLRRRFGAGFNLLVGVVAMLAIVVMLNHVASRHYKRFAWSDERDYKLSSITLQVLRGLTNQVKVTIYFDPDSALYSHVTALLKEYSLRNPRIILDTVNYVLEPGKAELTKATYKLPPATKDVIIFDGGGAPKVVNSSDLSNYDFNELLEGKSQNVRRKSFNGEQQFTSALIAVTDRTPQRAYLIVGHGEHNPDDKTRDEGYGRFSGLLQENNLELAYLSLLGTNDVPLDCQLLILAGPTHRLEQSEQEKLERYLSQGGRLFVLFRYMGESGMEPLLAKWGVGTADFLVVDVHNSKSDSFVVVGNYGSHAIVRPILQSSVPMQLAMPRPVGALANFPQSADAPQVSVLATTTAKGEAIANYRNSIRRNPLTDQTGAIPLAVAVEKGGVRGEARGRGATRLVVAGDSFFLDNQMLDQQANRDFAWNAVNWLLDRSALLGIPPRPVREFKFTMTELQTARVRWIVLGAFPGAVLFWGWLVYVRRQR
ncbi:MAG: GldG family protein [Verrucomicrobia bacterium]|nr:GldG family protein [Verrucomicrobiota bacterium]